MREQKASKLSEVPVATSIHKMDYNNVVLKVKLMIETINK